eukprot:COSAG06_NODE_40658_length_400_cov_0.445183_2_plen_36_part_01
MEKGRPAVLADGPGPGRSFEPDDDNDDDVINDVTND